LDALFARQVDPALQAREIAAELDLEKIAAEFGELLTGMTSADTAQEAQRRVGAFALAARTVPEAERRAAVSSRLPSPQWPARRILLVAVDAETGETRVFDRQSGVDLIDAVAASCAVTGGMSTAASGPATTPTSPRAAPGSWCCHRWATTRRSRRRCRCRTW
jgi:NTE family protein